MSASRAPTSSTAAHLAVDRSQKKFITVEAAVPSTTQNNSKRTTENSAANARTEGTRSMARRREEVRQEKHGRQQFSIRSTFQHHQSTRCIYETNKLERMGKIRYEEKMRAVRLREMTLKYEELLLRWKTSSLTRYHQSEEGRHKCSNVNRNGHEG